jgi:hypothetical protein
LWVFKNKDNVAPIHEKGKIEAQKMIILIGCGHCSGPSFNSLLQVTVLISPNVFIHKTGIRLNQLMECCADKVINNRKAL